MEVDQFEIIKGLIEEAAELRRQLSNQMQENKRLRERIVEETKDERSRIYALMNAAMEDIFG